MEFQIKCHLGYEVSGPASFLFNVAVAQNSFQRVIREHFEVGGAERCQEMVIGGQRYHRVTAQSGSVELVYEAVVDATRELLGDPSRRQVQFAKSQRISLAFVFAERPMLTRLSLLEAKLRCFWRKIGCEAA